MRNLIVMFVNAVCFLFLLKLKWPKNKTFYDKLTFLVNGSPQQSKPEPIKRMNSKPKEKYMELNGAQMQ